VKKKSEHLVSTTKKPKKAVEYRVRVVEKEKKPKEEN
jgi:hypothetical protein